MPAGPPVAVPSVDRLQNRPRAVRRDRAVTVLAAVLLAAFFAVAMLTGPSAQAEQGARPDRAGATGR